MGAIPCESSAPSCPQHSGKQVLCLACRALGNSKKELLGQVRDAEPLILPKALPSRIPIPELSGILLKPIHILLGFHIFFFWSRCCTGVIDASATMCRGDWEKGSDSALMGRVRNPGKDLFRCPKASLSSIPSSSLA